MKYNFDVINFASCSVLLAGHNSVFEEKLISLSMNFFTFREVSVVTVESGYTAPLVRPPILQ